MYVISNKIRLCLFALIMSFCTSTTVSGVTIFFSRDDLSEFFIVWLSSTIKSWPLVFLLIIFFVPIINRFLDKYFIIENDKNI